MYDLRSFGVRSNIAPIAQLVEQRTFNPLVDGSNPSGRTRTNTKERE